MFKSINRSYESRTGITGTGSHTGFPLGPSSPGSPRPPEVPAVPGCPASPFSPRSPLGPCEQDGLLRAAPGQLLNGMVAPPVGGLDQVIVHSPSFQVLLRFQEVQTHQALPVEQLS